VRNSDSANVRDVIRRKEEGIDVVLKRNVQAKEATTLLECVHLIHCALPEMDMAEIDLSTKFLGKKLGAPIVVDSMTGGAPKAEEINGTLAEVAEEKGFAMGLGSQRAGLLSESMARTYSIARKRAPTAFLFANIGGAQLAKGFSVENAEKLVSMIGADALAVHLNPLQEVVQPEGEAVFRGVLASISNLCEKVSVPVIVKEVGAGISREVAKKLEGAGVAAINVSGAGGTSWAGVEAIRASERNRSGKALLGALFWDWGIPTAAALMEVRKAVKVPVIASGGLRNGLEVAKCVALGANACGMARPMLEHASKGRSALEEFAEQTLLEVDNVHHGRQVCIRARDRQEGDHGAPDQLGWLTMVEYTLMLEDMKNVKGRVDRLVLEDLLPKTSPVPEVELLYRMMRDYPQRGGKGMRPYICVTSCKAFGGTEDDIILTAACLELFQNWILIHDDIEDGSELRRGAPALHKKYDWTLALNTGDALHARMWEALLRNRTRLGGERTMDIMDEFARMINETTEGQQMELSWVASKSWSLTEQDYFRMCTKKTSWYTIISPLRLGGIAVGAEPAALEALIDAGTNLGVAFQIHDDVLNLSAGSKYGKQYADDLLEGKRTLILIRLLQAATREEKQRIVELFAMSREARKERLDELLEMIDHHRVIVSASERAEQLLNQALSTMRKVRWPGETEAVLRLEEIARYSVERDW